MLAEICLVERGLPFWSSASSLGKGPDAPWAVIFLLTFLAVVPKLLLATTPMVRLLVVFHFLRQALGTQTAPSNQTLLALSFVLTGYLMQPVITSVNQVAVAPYLDGKISGLDAMRRGIVPPKSYMLRYTKEKDLALFAATAGLPRPRSSADLSLLVVAPSYMLSELRAGFEIGAMLFIPFLLVDIVVASVTTSIGMMQLPPVTISTPVKLFLFVMVDGWNLITGSLIKSFQ